MTDRSSETVDITLVTMCFDAADPVALAAVLARYVVATRGHDGCRNVDLCSSVTNANRFVIIEKWMSPDAQRAHFDSPDMVAMADACRGLLTRAPDIELLTGVSAHDLR